MRLRGITVLGLVAAGALVLGGCKSNSNTSAGMVSGKKESCSEGSGACCKGGDKASMGAVSEKKAGCCGGAAKADCKAPATTNN